MAVTSDVMVAPTSAVDPVVAEAMAMSARLVPLKNALGCGDLTNEEMDLFAMVALRMRLDPFAKQIYAVKRQGKVTFQTGIDGFRSSAEETNQYRGSDEPVFGPWVERPFGHPEWATVVVHRELPDGTHIAQSATAYFDEYLPGQGQDFQWKKMPRVMLAKCAEAAAFRKAFPKRFGGVYITEEMQQADAAATATPIQATVTTHRDRIAQQRAALTTSAAPALPDADQRPVQADTTGGTPSYPAAAEPSPEPGSSGEGDAVIEGEAREVESLTADELRDWLRSELIGISEAQAVAKRLFGNDHLARLTGKQRAELRAQLQAGARQ